MTESSAGRGNVAVHVAKPDCARALEPLVLLSASEVQWQPQTSSVAAVRLLMVLVWCCRLVVSGLDHGRTLHVTRSAGEAMALPSSPAVRSSLLIETSEALVLVAAVGGVLVLRSSPEARPLLHRSCPGCRK